MKYLKWKNKRAFEFYKENNNSIFEKIAITLCWINEIRYTDANSPLENDFENVASLLYYITVDIFVDLFTENVIDHIVQQVTLYVQQKINQGFSLAEKWLSQVALGGHVLATISWCWCTSGIQWAAEKAVQINKLYK